MTGSAASLACRTSTARTGSPRASCPAILTAACRDGSVTIRDAPESAKDYVHVEDAVEALIRIALDGRERIYNVASGRNVSHRELSDELRRVSGCTVDFEVDTASVVFPPIDTTRLQAEFPFSPRLVLDDLAELVDQCRAWLTAGQDPQLRERNDERPALAAVLALLIDHLVTHVPGQQQDVVRHLREQILGRADLEPRAGQAPALLLRVPVHDEVEHLACRSRVR